MHRCAGDLTFQKEGKHLYLVRSMIQYLKRVAERLASHCWNLRAIANGFESRCFPQEGWGHCDTKWYTDADL